MSEMGPSWESDEDDELPWDRDSAEERWRPSDAEAWRGDVHSDAWPEDLAGPEYWLYKRQEGDED